MNEERKGLTFVKQLQKNTPVFYGIIVLGIALLLFSSFMIFGNNNKKFQPLYKGLSGSDSIEIQSYLSQNNIEFKSEENGDDLYIKGDPILVKGELAKKGLPSNAEVTGLQRFDEMSIGSTKFDKEVQYQSRLQEDLERGISTAFDGIESASVKLPKIREKSIFDENNEEMTVSVAIKPNDGVKIDENNVKAIQLFVASSIQEISPENVEVVDNQMNVLSNGIDDDSLRSGKSAKIKEEAEKAINEDLEKTLTDVYGLVSVITRVDINFDEIVQNIEQYDPEGSLISTEELSERERKVDGGAGREPGANANGEVPGYEIENLNEEDSTYLKDKEHLIDNFQVGKTVEKVIRHPELRNTNVAVWIDRDLTEAEIENLTEMIAISSGLTGESELVQNDKAVYENGSVKVVQTPFASGEVDGEEGETVVNSTKIPIYVYVIILLLLLSLIIMAVIMIRKNKRKETDKEVFGPENEVFVEKEEKEKEPITEEIESEEEEVEEQDDFESNKFTFEWTDKRKKQKELMNRATEKNPDITANVIKELLKSEKDD